MTCAPLPFNELHREVPDSTGGTARASTKRAGRRFCSSRGAGS